MDDEDDDDLDGEVPDGAALFPLIPAELGIHPVLLGVLHAIVFIEGSEATVVQPDASAEAIEYVATYLQRLDGPELDRVRTDLVKLTDHARREKWSKPEVQFLKNFLADFGIGPESQS